MPANANFFFDPYRRDYWQAPRSYYEPYYQTYGDRPYPGRSTKRNRAVKKPNVERPLSAAEKQSDADLKAKVQQGPLLVMISIDDQSLGLYSNGELIARSKVSTGVPGTRRQRVIQPIRNGASSFHIYSDAPMPYMQSITGRHALHQGVVPGPPLRTAVSFAEAFARQLWGISKIGARVIITRGDNSAHAFGMRACLSRTGRRSARRRRAASTSEG